MKRHTFAPAVATAVALSLSLAACGGRDAHPVAVTQPTDAMLTCELMYAEISANNQRVRALADEKSDAENGNVALGVAGAVLFWPALFFMDLSDAERVEMDALNARNTYLQKRMITEDCGDVPPATVEAEDRQRVKEAVEAADSGDGPPPKCDDVGGYESYMKATGRVCEL